MQPIRRRTSILDLPPRELARLFTQAVGFATIAYVAFSAIGFAPAALDLFGSFRAPEARSAGELPVAQAAEEPAGPTTRTVPTHVSIPKIGVDATVYQPAAIDVPTLDDLLSKGAVYYPGSGVLEGGNVFIFGHSTNWPIVRNQAYKTFNGLDKLATGDSIYLTSGNDRFEYHVTSVRIAPDSEIIVKFDAGSHRLTLSTCNTFGLKQERIVVEAEYVAGGPSTDN